MKNVFFGLGLEYEKGIHARVALGRDGRIIEVHESADDNDLNYRTGHLRQMAIEWDDSVAYGEGAEPGVAIDGRRVVEVHRSDTGPDLYCRVGVWEDDGIVFGDAVKYASGEAPCVAMNRQAVVEVHESRWNSKIWYNLGGFDEDGGAIVWLGNTYLDVGTQPSIAINAQNDVVMVRGNESNSDLHYRIGKLGLDGIAWGPPTRFDSGSRASVALTAEGEVLAVYESTDKKTLLQRFGKIRGKSIDWAAEAVHFDDGVRPCVACSGGMAIQVHESENFNALWASTSRIVDRSRWMQDHLRVLGDLTLPRLTTGASHDAGMYQHGVLMSLGKTQNLDLYQQLGNGIRYFDLRPKWDGSALYVSHGPITGPALAEIVGDVERFMKEGHRELVVLKFSHYAKFTDGVYEQLVELLQDKLGRWLFMHLPQDARLSDIPLGEFLRHSGVVLVVCDDDYPVRIPAAGIWVYRDSNSPTAELGDLRVYDQYSNTTSYDTMSTDQIAKFRAYDGFCVDQRELPCDQFLLSWTLTPPTGVWLISKEANRNLGAEMAVLPRDNDNGCVINQLYVDYEEYSRATDVAMSMNGIP
ncbi:hypothetical protein [Lysobacter sp. CA196]|uniref:hypothetical protein n=1 Tax=Lysobacter sp. CA196 TaxID=3455606 RepID=UPI003F8D5947